MLVLTRKGGIVISEKSKKNLFRRELTLLHRRAQAAYEAQDDEALIKLVTCLCKVAEAEAKLGTAEHESVEVTLRGDPAPEGA